MYRLCNGVEYSKNAFTPAKLAIIGFVGMVESFNIPVMQIYHGLSALIVYYTYCKTGRLRVPGEPG
jgi:hypothetical protein